MHCPSVLLVVIALGLEGTVAASTSLIIHSYDDRDFALGAIGLALSLVLPVWTCYVGMQVKDHCTLVDRKHTDPPKNVVARLIVWLTVSDKYWSYDNPTGREFKHKYFFAFVDHRFWWFVTFDFATMIIIGVTDGIRIDDYRICIALVIISFINALVTLILLLCFDAALVRIDKIFLCAVSLGTLAICCSGIAQLVVSNPATVVAVTEYLSTAMIIIVLIKSVLDVIMLGAWVQSNGSLSFMKFFDTEPTASASKHGGGAKHQQFTMMMLSEPLLDIVDEGSKSGEPIDVVAEQGVSDAAAIADALDEELDALLESSHDEDEEPLDDLLGGFDADELACATTAKFGEGARLFQEVEAGLRATQRNDYDDQLAAAVAELDDLLGDASLPPPPPAASGVA